MGGAVKPEHVDRSRTARGLENHPPKVEMTPCSDIFLEGRAQPLRRWVAGAKITASFRLAGELLLRPLDNSPEKVPFEGQEF